ncbi:hypothetical protein [Novosphingobium sp.]|uniref:hypothetical protein n=1 Tax=Novosphingobium sp. TaxID=1874826 RepID=UPI00261FBAC0|nr:hypothetical protein [Novosphingobium sp.]
MPNPPVTFPAMFTPANAVAFANADGTAQTVSADAPLPVALSGSVGTQAVSAVSLPLPTGAATAANQSATNAALGTLSAQLPATLGQKTMAQSLPVTLASDTSALGVTVGNFPATQTVTATSLPLPAGAATAANQTSGNTSLAAISGQLPASLGPKPSSASLSVGLASDLANIEPGAAAITGTTMPAGGTGITGWLSAIYRSCSEGATLAGSVTSAAVVVSTSNNLCMGGSFQVTNAGTTCTITYEQSNDGTNWVTLPVVSAAAANAAPATTSTAAGIYTYVSSAAFVRARVSTYTSGTVAVVLSQKQQVAPSSGVSLAAGASGIGSVSVTGTTTITGSVNLGNGFTDSTAALGASATFTGTGRANSAGQFAFFNATAFADQAGTLFIDQSLDTGTSYQAIASQAVAAGSGANISVRMCGAVGTATMYRVRYVNGAGAQTTFRLSSSFSAS